MVSSCSYVLRVTSWNVAGSSAAHGRLAQKVGDGEIEVPPPAFAETQSRKLAVGSAGMAVRQHQGVFEFPNIVGVYSIEQAVAQQSSSRQPHIVVKAGLASRIVWSAGEFVMTSETLRMRARNRSSDARKAVSTLRRSVSSS